MDDGWQGHTYEVRLEGDETQEASQIQFRAGSAEVAVQRALKFSRTRQVHLFEDGRKLASIRTAGRNGFWIVN